MIRSINKKKIIALIVLVLLIVLLVHMLAGQSGDSRSFAESDGKKAHAEEIVNAMTLEEKVYQMLIVSPEQITGVETVVAAGETTRQALQTYPVGGLIYTKKNILDKNQIRDVIQASQTYSKTGLLIAIDEEGTNAGLKTMYSYKNKGKRKAAANAAQIAEYIRGMGFNLDLAPTADVWSNSRNTVVSDHAYSDDFKQAAGLVSAAVRGFHDKGVICTLKHFPGAGDLTEELATGYTYLDKTEKEIRGNEMKPFQAGIDAGADIVMTGHMTVNAIDKGQPASLSEKVVTKTLREEMGFKGLTMTDSLSDEVLTERFSAGEAAVLAVKAGNDIILKPDSVEDAVNAIINAVSTGSISEAQINESVTRIIETKLNAGIIR